MCERGDFWPKQLKELRFAEMGRLGEENIWFGGDGKRNWKFSWRFQLVI